MGSDLPEQFAAIIRFYGPGSFFDWCQKRQIYLPETYLKLFEECKERQPVWTEFVNHDNIKLFDKQGIDLLSRMTQLNPVCSPGGEDSDGGHPRPPILPG